MNDITVTVNGTRKTAPRAVFFRISFTVKGPAGVTENAVSVASSLTVIWPP